MLRGWFDSTFGNGSLLAQVVVVITLLVLVLAVLAWLFGRRRSGGVSRGPARGRQPRLSVMEAAIVDSKRRLVLVRRDQIEHLVMIGGPTDIVVETNIVRGRPAGFGIPGRRPAPGSRPQQQAPAVPGHQMPPAGAAIATSAAATAAAVLRHPAGNAQVDPVSEFRRGSGNGSVPLAPAPGSRPVSPPGSAVDRDAAALDISAFDPALANHPAIADPRHPAMPPPEPATLKSVAAMGHAPGQTVGSGSVAFAGLAAGAAALAAAAGNKSRKPDGETAARRETVETTAASHALKVTTPSPVQLRSETVQPAPVAEIAAFTPPAPAQEPPVNVEPDHEQEVAADPDPLGDLESEFEKAFETSLQDLNPTAQSADTLAAADEAVPEDDAVQPDATELETVEPEELAIESEETVLVAETVADAPVQELVEEVADPEETVMVHEQVPAEAEYLSETPEILDDDEIALQSDQFQSVTELPVEDVEEPVADVDDNVEPAVALDDEMDDTDEPAFESMAPMAEETTIVETVEVPTSEAMVAPEDAAHETAQADTVSESTPDSEMEPAEPGSEIDLDYLEASLSSAPAALQRQPETTAGEDEILEVTAEAEPEPVAEVEAEIVDDIPEPEAEEEPEFEQAEESSVEYEATAEADVEPVIEQLSEPESEPEIETEPEAVPDETAETEPAETEEERSPSGLPAELAFLDQPVTADEMEAEIEPPVAEQPAAPKPAVKSVNPFPTIPENVRRSVMEAARRAVSPEVAEGIAAGTNTDVAATTLGDLAQRLEKALSEQASGKGTTPPSSPEDVPAAAADEAMPAEAEAESGEDQAAEDMERAVIDFNSRRKDEPDPEDALEDEMARLLNDLTGDTNRVG